MQPSLALVLAAAVDFSRQSVKLLIKDKQIMSSNQHSMQKTRATSRRVIHTSLLRIKSQTRTLVYWCSQLLFKLLKQFLTHHVQQQNTPTNMDNHFLVYLDKALVHQQSLRKHYRTSNVTGRHRGLKHKRMYVCRYMVPPGECYSNTVLCCAYYLSSLSSVVSWTFSVPCVYSTFGHHPHPLGYLCAKFRFFAASIAELAHGEKLHTHSHTRSLTQLIWCPGNWSAYTSER